MNLDKELKEAFMKHAEDVRPDAGSWNAVETKVKRAHHARVVAVSTFTVALIAAAAIVLPRLGTKSQQGFSNGAHESPGTSFSARAVQVGDRYVGAPEGFSVQIPASWKAGWFEGVYEYGPKSLPSAEQGKATFFVSIRLVEGLYDRPDTTQGVPGTKTEFHGLPYVEYDPPAASDGSQRTTFRYRWNECVPGQTNCSPASANNTLEMIMFGSNQQLWGAHRNEADLLWSSLAKYDGSDPAHGTFPGTVNDTTFTEAGHLLVKFLDARVQGFDAELFMDTKAQEAFGKSSNCLDLYQSRVSHKNWTTYEVPSGFLSGSDVKFTVIMSVGSNGGYVETITVGKQRRGPSYPWVILDAGNSCNPGT